MIEKTSTEVAAGDGAAQQEEAGFPFPFPIRVQASGLYEVEPILFPLPWPIPIPLPEPFPEPIPRPIPIPPGPGPGPTPGPVPGPRVEEQETEAKAFSIFPLFRKEELRLDVDGFYPQMVASGVVNLKFSRVNWVANLVSAGPNHYTGTIWYRDGAVASFPYMAVDITTTGGFWPASRQATVHFIGGGGLTRTRTFKFKSSYFHDVDFEFDCAQGESATLSVDTCAHPNRSATLPCETLTIQKVYQRAGFNVTTSPGGTVPISGAGPGARWSDTEMHDAMQVYWSRFSATAQWAMWVFFASLHETGTSLGGIMFDDIGAQHRQGTAIFNDAFISVPPSGEANPAAWVQRMIFWTACHEMGHAFNLAHSWQKALGTPWIPGLANEPEARSFMNYPYNVAGGQSAFFANFQFRFSNGELLFMRHAPAPLVQMGNAAWFDHHGFEEANVSPEPTLQLELRANRSKTIFEFLEPVTLELKLTNVSPQPELLNQNSLKSLDSMTIIIKKDGKNARQFRPFAQYCYVPEKGVLLPGQSVYEPLFLSAGQNGWDLAEPGRYTVQVAFERDGEDIVSNTVRIRVAPPRGYDEEYIAQDFFTEDVGRILAFDGSEVLTQGKETLADVTQRLGDRRVALHAALALGLTASREYKTLVEDSQSPVGIAIKARKPQTEEARELLEHALVRRGQEGAESFGHITYKRYVDRFSDWLAEQGDPDAAAETQDTLRETLAAREVRGRKVLGHVLDDVEAKRDSYRARAKGKKTTRKKTTRKK